MKNAIKSIKKAVGIAALIGFLGVTPAYSYGRTIDIKRFKSNHELKQVILPYYGRKTKHNIYFNNKLLLCKGKVITKRRYNQLINFYNNRNNIFIDRQGMEYRNIPGVNSYSKHYNYNKDYCNKSWDGFRNRIKRHEQYNKRCYYGG